MFDDIKRHDHVYAFLRLALELVEYVALLNAGYTESASRQDLLVRPVHSNCVGKACFAGKVQKRPVTAAQVKYLRCPVWGEMLANELPEVRRPRPKPLNRSGGHNFSTPMDVCIVDAGSIASVERDGLPRHYGSS